MEAKRVACEMLKTALFESESAVRKVLNGLVQEERIRYNKNCCYNRLSNIVSLSISSHYRAKNK